jgi:hypothetical protein
MWKPMIISAIVAGATSLAAPTLASADDRDRIATADEGRVSVLGYDICFDDALNRWGCDVTLPLAQPAERITLVDTTLCIGGDADAAGCDYRMPDVGTK